jgi:flavin-dependent dehydrogenase
MVGTMTSPSVPPVPTSAIAPRYDVVIVGARAAGASTAMLLARQGLSVLAVDRSAYGSDTLSTHSLARAGVLQLSRWGLLDRLRAEGTPVARKVVFRYDDDPKVIDISPEGDVDGLYSPRRTVLDRILVDAAVDAGADVFHGISVTAVTNSNGRVSGVDLDVDGEHRHVDADWVIGADGARSRVAAQVGARIIHEENATASNIYAYWTGLADDVIENHFDITGRAVGVIPTNDGEACVWIGIAPERFREEARGDLSGAYHRVIAESPRLTELLRTATCTGRYRGFAGTPGFLREAFGPGWALVGDAGYFKDPVSAHGITDAFIGAELLSDALVAVINDGAEPDEAIGAYQRQRDELAAMLMPPVAALARLDLDPAGAKAAFRSLNPALRAEFELMAGRSTRVLAGV